MKSGHKNLKFNLFILLLLPCFFGTSQGDTFRKDTTFVFIQTDFNHAGSGNDKRQAAQAGTGKVGLRFDEPQFYGACQFTVYSKNETISTQDSTELSLFGSSLLLPQNSSGQISNFSIELGTKSFFNVREFDLETDLPFLSFKKFGLHSYYHVNNTTWSKNLTELPVSINSFGVSLTYLLLNLRLFDNQERIRLLMSFGYASRRLGGNYGLDENKTLRQNFLGTEKLGFNGTEFNIRLEVAKIYGSFCLSSFARKGNIAGFSGNQSVISLGLTADLKIATKNMNLQK